MSKSKKSVSLKQSHALMAVIGQNADWNAILNDAAQALIDDPIGTGAKFVEFVNNLSQTPVQAKPGFDGNVKLVQTPKQSKGGIVTLQEMLDDAARFGTLKGAYDYYREDESRIPAEWKGKIVFFPETEFLGGGRQCVRYLDWDGSCWLWGYDWVSSRVDSDSFVAVSASIP
jgi:hypothetical protein